MNKKGQNGSRRKVATGFSRAAALATGTADIVCAGTIRCHCPRAAGLLAERRGLWVRIPPAAVGTTDAPVQHNLLLEYRNQPRLSVGANITSEKRDDR